MTKLGKIFVLINTAFSFTMLAWALALYANRIDWSDQREGELTRRLETVRQLQAAIAPAQTAWREGRLRIAALEAQRPGDRQWYIQELRHLQSQASADSPARTVVFERGVPVPDPMNGNRPRMVPAGGLMDQPLASLEFYQREMQQTLQATAVQADRLTKAIQEDIDETDKLIAVRQQLVDERQKIADLVKEHEVVRPQLINAFVESQLILRRAESLKQRIRELEGVGVARGE